MIRRAKSTSSTSLPNVAGALKLTRGGMQRTLGIRVISITPDKVTAEMPIGPQHLSVHGRVTGGVIMAFADSVGAMGTVARLAPGYWTTTLESKTNFFAPGEAPAVSAVSIPLHVGRTTMVLQTTLTNTNGRTVAIVTQTQIVMPPKPAAPATTRRPPNPAPKKPGPGRRSSPSKK